jgi:hypothetical protein
MPENLKQSLTYSLGLIHGTKNVLRRILKSIQVMNPAAGAQRLIDYYRLIVTINETEIVKENGAFVANEIQGTIDFEWIPERAELILSEIKNAEL